MADIKARRDEIIEIARSYGGSNVRTWGAITPQDPDVVFVLRFEPECSRSDMEALLIQLSDLLGTKVHLLGETALQGSFGRTVRKDAVPL